LINLYVVDAYMAVPVLEAELQLLQPDPGFVRNPPN
jgi:hypothetical protein